MSSKKFNLKVKTKINPFKKTIKVDSDKSLSIRSFLIGAISQKISTISNVLESEDVKSTINACKKLGVKIFKKKRGKYIVYGRGLGSLVAKKNTLINFGNSGTLARLLIGILSSNPNIQVSLTGDHSLKKRSMKKLIDLMTQFGASFIPNGKINLPLRLISSKMPIGINYQAGVSAQLKSAVIFSGLNSYGMTIIKERFKSRDHTENFLKSNTEAIKVFDNKIKTIKIYGKKELKPINFKIPGDPSSAAFFTALTLLNKDSSLKIKNVGLNKTRIGFYDILKKQKANIKFVNIIKRNNEFVGDLIVKSTKLKPFFVPANLYPRTTDEYLILFVMASLIKGVSVFKGISDLSNKESSRAYEMAKILKQIGIKCKLKKDEMKIYGLGMINADKKFIEVGNLGDHRIAMCAFILAVLTNAKAHIKNFETVFTSSPSFLKIMKSFGVKFEIQK